MTWAMGTAADLIGPVDGAGYRRGGFIVPDGVFAPP
jgi:hypothetical protein